MLKKIFLCFSCLIVSFNLVYVQPARALFFIPALANPVTMSVLGNIMVGGIAGTMGVIKTKEIYDDITGWVNSEEGQQTVDRLKNNINVVYDKTKKGVMKVYYTGNDIISDAGVSFKNGMISMANAFKTYVSSLPEKVSGFLDMKSYTVPYTTSYPDYIVNATVNSNGTVRGDFYAPKEYKLVYVSTTGAVYATDTIDPSMYSADLKKLRFYMPIFWGLTSNASKYLDVDNFDYIGNWGNAEDVRDFIAKNVTTLENWMSYVKKYALKDGTLMVLTSSEAIALANTINVAINQSLDTSSYPSIDADTPFYFPVPTAKTIEKVNDIPAGTDLLFNPVSQAWETPQGKVFQGTDAQLDVAIPNIKVLTNPDGTVITDANGIPRTVATSDGVTWIDTKTGETVTTGTGEGTIPKDLTILEKILEAIKSILSWLDSFFAKLEALLINILTSLFVPSETFVTENINRLRTNFNSKFPDLYLIPGFFDSIDFRDGSCDFDFSGKVFGKQYEFINTQYLFKYAPWWKGIMSAVMWFFVCAYGYRRISSIIAGRHGAK